MDTMTEPPEEIIRSANAIDNWAKENGLTYWELLGICDRRFTFNARIQTPDHQMDDFRRQLKHLLNSVSMENRSNTPHFILAQYMTDCLEAFERATNQRQAWYGKKPKPIDP